MKSKEHFFKPISQLLDDLKHVSITNDRKSELNEIARYILTKLQKNEEVNLNFLCNYNSRRSQLLQVWSKTCADYFKVPVNTYSGGLKSANIPIIVIETLKTQGFKVVSKDSNPPIYFLFYSDEKDPLILYSKHFSDPINKQRKFVSIINCKQANYHCPPMPHAEKEISLYYLDPIVFDNEEKTLEQYLQLSNAIASDMTYLFHNIKKAIKEKRASTLSIPTAT
ncbi:hypothetical protein [Marivirga sp.]|uniref:hypothetical protein n=1 Tax=Marivirga sp. TaxID=2018662 RepID=UPI003DA7197F